jgi:hypothetical protein
MKEVNPITEKYELKFDVKMHDVVNEFIQSP